MTGQFVDGNVSNIAYETSSGRKGRTDLQGAFSYVEGDTVKFMIGKLAIGEGKAGPLVTPMTLVAGSTLTSDAGVVKILQLLQTLDTDGNPGNGIQLAEDLHTRLQLLADSTELKKVTDLTTEVINKAYGTTKPALVTPDAAIKHFSDTLAAIEAGKIVASISAVSNIAIGGGLKSCSSFNGSGKSANCGADWAEIIRLDPAFAGLGFDNVLFDSAVTIPTFTYSITADRLAAFNALPEALVSVPRKASLTSIINARIADAVKPKNGLQFAAFDEGRALYADGTAFWSNGDNGDWKMMVSTFCGSFPSVTATSPLSSAPCNLSDAAVTTVANATFVRPDDRPKLVLVLRELQNKFGTNGSFYYNTTSVSSVVKPNFRTEFRLVKLADDGGPVVNGITNGLTPTEVAALRNAFVDALVPNRNNRKVQARSVAYLTDRASLDMYSVFIKAATAAAGGKKPTIGFVTASTENAFNDRDINFYALKSAGANVVYIPLEGGLRKAIDAGDCANTATYYTRNANTQASGSYFHMDQVFPDLAELQRTSCLNNAATLNTTLQGLDGIFFTGGDQARHLESFVTRDAAGAYTQISPQLEVLRARFAAGKLVVSGTSAGDAAQSGGIWKGISVPMVSGGDSWQALAKGYIAGTGPTIDGAGTTGVSYATGGLGFFKYGTLDSHFSNRSREGRLLRLIRESGLDYGFGVDENTSLVVGRPEADGSTKMTVVGEAGVYIVDVRGSTSTGSSTGNFTITGAKTHYITEGDYIVIDSAGNMTVTLSSTKPVLATKADAATVVQTRAQESGLLNYLKMLQNMGLTGAAKAFGTTEGTSGMSAPLYSMLHERGAGTVFKGVTGGRVSYTNVVVTVNPCPANVCTAP